MSFLFSQASAAHNMPSDVRHYKKIAQSEHRFPKCLDKWQADVRNDGRCEASCRRPLGEKMP